MSQPVVPFLIPFALVALVLGTAIVAVICGGAPALLALKGLVFVLTGLVVAFERWRRPPSGPLQAVVTV